MRLMKRSSVGLRAENDGETGFLEPTLEQSIVVVVIELQRE